MRTYCLVDLHRAKIDQRGLFPRCGMGGEAPEVLLGGPSFFLLSLPYKDDVLMIPVHGPILLVCL